MDRLFRIDFYPQDWIIDTARLTLEERGLYIQIVALIYSNRGPIVNDAQWIAGVSNCSVRAAKSIIQILIDKGFLRLTDGKLGQKRAENELNSKRKSLENSSKGGRARAENSRTSPENEGDDNENNDLASSGTSKPLTAPTPTPTPSPTPNKDRESAPKKSGTRLPENWKAGDEFINFALSEGMTIEKAEREVGFFRDYWISQPGQKGVKLDWLATWRNWIRREIDRGGKASRSGHMPNGKPDYFGGLMTAAQKAAKATEGM